MWWTSTILFVNQALHIFKNVFQLFIDSNPFEERNEIHWICSVAVCHLVMSSFSQSEIDSLHIFKKITNPPE